MTDERLQPGFTFTQTALRTYQECPYRFYLRYLAKVPWPAWPAEAATAAALERGRRFHELARQHFLGLEAGEQARAAGGDLATWWTALQTAPPDLAAWPRRLPEAGLSVPLGEYRLAARYDLLAMGEESALIVDWKTGRPLPAAAALAQDTQTRVYLYVLAEGSAVYAGRPLAPDALALLYWHPAGPTQVRLPYSQARHRADGGFLGALVQEIAARRPQEMARTTDECACRQCAYAPLCGREGRAAGEWEAEEEPAVEAETWIAEPS